jgi:hypothetical protein
MGLPSHTKKQYLLPAPLPQTPRSWVDVLWRVPGCGLKVDGAARCCSTSSEMDTASFPDLTGRLDHQASSELPYVPFLVPVFLTSVWACYVIDL